MKQHYLIDHTRNLITDIHNDYDDTLLRRKRSNNITCYVATDINFHNIFLTKYNYQIVSYATMLEEKGLVNYVAREGNVIVATMKVAGLDLYETYMLGRAISEYQDRHAHAWMDKLEWHIRSVELVDNANALLFTIYTRCNEEEKQEMLDNAEAFALSVKKNVSSM